MPYSLKAISIGSTGCVIIFEVSKSIISRLLFLGRETPKIITRQGSVESFLRYRLSGTAHASLQDNSTNIWYKTLGISSEQSSPMIRLFLDCRGSYVRVWSRSQGARDTTVKKAFAGSEFTVQGYPMKSGLKVAFLLLTFTNPKP